MMSTTLQRLLTLVLALLLATAGTHAGACGLGGATCTDPSPTTQPATGALNLGAGNPINVATGNKYQREVDLAPLPGVMGLEIVRYYNSTLSGPATLPNAVGRGWRLSYETRLVATRYAVEIAQADGSVVAFARDAVQPAVAMPRDPAQGSVEIRRGARGDEYVWTWTDGRKLSFDHRGLLQQVQAPTGEILALQYDARGLLVRVNDPQGRSLHLAWLDSGAARKGDRFRGVQAIDSPVGRYTYQYGSTAPAGAHVDHVALLANLVRVGYPDSPGSAARGRRYHYEDAAHPTLLTGISIEASQAGAKQDAVTRYATYAYGPDGRAIHSRHAGNVGAIDVRYEKGLTTVTNSLGDVTVFRHGVVNDEYRILEVRGAGCSGCTPPNRRYGYDRLGRLTETTLLDRAGLPLETTRSTLDRYGRPLQVQRIAYAGGQAQPAQLLARYDYGAGPAALPTLIAKPSVVPGKETVTRIRYNAAGQRTSVTEAGWRPAVGAGDAATPVTRTTTLAYSAINGRSLLTRIDGPLPGATTRIEYDARGNAITRVTAPGTQVTTVAAVDDIGRPATIVTPDGIETRVEYDRDGHARRLVKAGIAQTYTYAALGALASTASATGERIAFDYAASGQLVAIADGQGNRIQLQWNTEDELVSRTLLNPDGSIAQESELTRYIPADTKDAAGARARVDAQVAGAAVGLAAEGLDAASLMAGRADAGKAGIDVDFDPAHRLARVEDTRHKQTGYLHDDFGRLAGIVSPDAGTIRFTWDASDRLVEKITGVGTPDEARIGYRYDGAGRVVEQRTREGVTSIAYGAQGRPVRIAYPGGEEAFDYDAAARLTRHARLVDGQRVTTLYRYNQLGQLVEKTLPDGQVLAYRYNAADQPKPGLLTGISRRDLFGQTVLLSGLNEAADGYADERYRLANGVDYVRQLDRFGQVRHLGSPGIWEEDQARSASGLLERRTVAAMGRVQTTGLAYDVLGRLQGIGQPGGNDARGYAYDPAGNLLGQVVGSARTVYRVAPDSNRLVAAEHGDVIRYYAYNGAGSVTRDGDTAYTWDSQQRLVKVARAGQLVAEYAYNAFGERIRKTSYAGNQKKVTYYFYDGAELVAEAEPDAGAIAVTRQYAWLEEYGQARPIALLQHRAGGAGIADAALGALPSERAKSASRARQTDVYAIVADHTGAPRAVVDERHQAVWRADVDGFGEATVGAGSALALNLRGSNQYFDAETGLHYNRHRYLDVASGRYLSADPSGQQGGANLYAFADNNPVDNVDPLGLQSKPAGAVSTWSMQDKLKFVLERVATKFPGELGNALLELVSPTAIATTAAIFGVWAAAQFTPYGWAADIAASGIGYLFMGKAVFDVIKGLWDSASLILNAKCEADLNKAGDILASGLGKAVAATAAAAASTGAAKVAKMLRTVFKNANVEASATAAAINQSFYGRFIPGQMRNGAAVNAEFQSLATGRHPPWASNKSVLDTWLSPGSGANKTKIYMVNGAGGAPGGWATNRTFATLKEARDALALLPEFTAGKGTLVVQEYEVISPIPVREGWAGPLTSPSNGITYPGGGLQWQMLADFRNGAWQNFLRRTGETALRP